MSSRLNTLIASFIKDSFISVEDFAVKKIDFSLCKAKSHNRFIPENAPYLIPVFRASDFTGVKKEITIMAPEQTCKSFAWQCFLLWCLGYKPGQSIVVYPSDVKCQQINEGRILPLMQAISELAEQLSRPHSKRINSYNLADSISYFMGAGSRITSIPANILIADEIDDWEEHEGQVSNLDDLRKRARSFAESMLFKVCTPTTTGGAIAKEFYNSSQGYWHLRCFGCGKLTMPSHNINQILKFESDVVDNQRVLRKGTEIYLKCPECGHKHKESQAHEMNLQGDYIHKVPELININVGFQWGALARPDMPDFSFHNLALEQLKSGKTGTRKDRMKFYNSFCGMPYNNKIADDIDLPDELLKHKADTLPDVKDLEAIFVTIDTQNKYWKWQMVGLDINSNRHVLAYGSADFLELDEEKRNELNEQREKEAIASGSTYHPIVTLEDVLYMDYHGMEVKLAMVDEGGFNKDRLSLFVNKHEKLFAYKGDSRINRAWKFSDDKVRQPKLIFAQAKEYQAELIYYLYNQPDTSTYYWFFHPDTDTSYIKEINAFKPTDRPAGQEPENWTHENRVHDWFDISKMYFVLEDVAITHLDSSHWQHGKAQVLENILLEDKEPESPTTSASKKSWMKAF